MEAATSRSYTPEEIERYNGSRVGDDPRTEFIARAGEELAGYAADFRYAVQGLKDRGAGNIDEESFASMVKTHPGFTVPDGRPEETTHLSRAGILKLAELRTKESRVYDSSLVRQSIKIRSAAAKIADMYAEALMLWAAFLYDKPVSQAYIDQHPDIEFDPYGLLKLEEEIEGGQGRIDYQELEQKRSILEDVMSGKASQVR